MEKKLTLKERLKGEVEKATGLAVVDFDDDGKIIGFYGEKYFLGIYNRKTEKLQINFPE